MTSSLENKVSRLRKIKEMLSELDDMIKPLKEEAQKLEDEVMAEFSAKPSLYNVCKKKTVAMGFVGKELVRVDFGKQLERVDGGRRDDQEWLRKIEESLPGCGYVKTKYELNAQKIHGDLKADVLTDDGLRKSFGLKLGASYKVKIYRTPDDAVVKAMKEEAEKMADQIESASHNLA